MEIVYISRLFAFLILHQVKSGLNKIVANCDGAPSINFCRPILLIGEARHSGVSLYTWVRCAVCAE
jgi:hypothetical protein